MWMQLNHFTITCFLMTILIKIECGSVAPTIGSGSYQIQAGFVALTATDIAAFQASNATVIKSHIISLKYSIATYNLAIGLKKVNWQFDTNQSNKELTAYCPTKNATKFTINFYSTFGSSVLDIEVSYLAVDTALNSYIFFDTGGSYLAVVAQAGTTWPVNQSMSPSYSSMAWSGYLSTTKVLIYCPYFRYNPPLSTANHSLGVYLKLTSVGPSTFIVNYVTPFGIDNFTRYDSLIVFFNPAQLYTATSIILNIAFLSSGDQLSVKTLSNTSLYTYTYSPGLGCDMTDNNTFIALQPYIAASTQLNFQFSLSSNSVFAKAQNYYIFNFSVINFCSKICSTATNPFMYRVDSQCYDVCPDGYYGNTTTTFCELCQLNCSTCSINQTYCTACVNGTTLSGHTCTTAITCVGNCLTCAVIGTNCTSCVNNTYLLNFACLSTCPLGTYPDTVNLVCVACQVHCLNCTSTQCITCDGIQYLYNSACVASCPSTTYVSGSQCLNCSNTCQNCSISATNCTSCVAPATLVSNQCILVCTGNCLTCVTTPTSCTSCVNNTYLLTSACLVNCPAGTFKDTVNRVCASCPLHCLNCSSISQCFACDGIQFLSLASNLCVASCPSTTYADTTYDECLNCTAPCLNCQTSSTNCTSCIVNTFLLNNDCLSSCPLRFYANTSLGICAVCPIYCQNCSSFTQCYSCQNGSFLYNFTCILSCPNTTYGDTSINECVNCNGTCYNCDYESSNCTSCINNTFLLYFDCFYNCPAGYYGNSSTGNCQACFTNCSTCTAVNVCTHCILNLYVSPNFDQCLKSCPANYFPNAATKVCQKIVIQGCISALYLNGLPFCLQCNVSQHYQFSSKTKSCICKNGYIQNNGTCQEYCGDGIIYSMPCDDGNFINGDGCSSMCTVESNFNCISAPNGPTLTSYCAYLPEINIQILSQTKIEDQNTLKLIFNISPAPTSLTSDEIKQFLNMKIGNNTINMANLQINYKNGIAQIYVPFTSDIQNQNLSLWTQLDPTKFSSSNIHISSILKGDNVALLYSSDLTLYKVLGTFNFSMAIFVCIFALLSTYKHKMIGLELIMPFQVILYSQAFYNLKTLQTSFYTSFKPVSFSIFTPDESGSKNNSWYKIGMTGGFLQNYNFLGFFFLISTILLIVSMFKLQHGQRNRFKHKKAMRDWLNFGQFKILIRNYEPIIWKPYFVSFCLSTIPLIFSVSAKAMTVPPNFYTQSLFDVINDKCNYLFYILLMGGLFYTSIPRIFYNNKKNLLKKHIFKREGEKFKYDANYCMYFELHYLSIGFIYAYCPSTLPVFYAISAINWLFFLYLIVKRPYESILDNIGALLSNSIVVYFLSMNLYIKFSGSSQIIKFLSKISGFLITFLLLVECLVAIVRLIIFWAYDKEQNLKGLTTDQKIDKFQYQKDKAFNKFVKKGAAQDEQAQFNDMMNQIQGQMILNQPRTINQQLIPKLYKANSNSNNENGRNQQSVINQIEQNNQSIQENYSSLQRVKTGLKESLKNYKLQQQQRQSRTYPQNRANPSFRH